ncbi:hypothetical protein [Xylanimonas ulmi]|uniref:hypothetical protein n=1 Tax=Xylanimonas ulmi TaxID=228973 RepID=UPI00102D0D66|nr:hypothetical protein [Xylanibacterium ulmi]
MSDPNTSPIEAVLVAALRSASVTPDVEADTLVPIDVERAGPAARLDMDAVDTLRGDVEAGQ